MIKFGTTTLRQSFARDKENCLDILLTVRFTEQRMFCKNTIVRVFARIHVETTI